MAVKMGLFLVSLILFVTGSNAAGEFSILHSPDSLKFTESSKTLESLLKEIFSASLGLSVGENAEWNGLSVTDPFATPEAVVEVYVDGVSSLGHFAGSKPKLTYNLIVDEYEPDAFESIKHRINQRFSNGGNKLVNMKLSDADELIAYPEVFADVTPPKVNKRTLQYLKADEKEARQFLYELEALKAITKKVNAHTIVPDNVVDFYNFRFQSLHALSDFHGPDSQEVKEAKKLLNEAISELTSAFVRAYDGSVLVGTVATDVVHTRRPADPHARRSVRSVETRADDKKMVKTASMRKKIDGTYQLDNLKSTNSTKLRDDAPNPPPVDEKQPPSTEEDNYSSDYPAIFNIILWFSVVMVFTLVAITYTLMDMDPGRDSIIYRMTSTRMKKDN